MAMISAKLQGIVSQFAILVMVLGLSAINASKASAQGYSHHHGPCHDSCSHRRSHNHHHPQGHRPRFSPQYPTPYPRDYYVPSIAPNPFGDSPQLYVPPVRLYYGRPGW